MGNGLQEFLANKFVSLVLVVQQSYRRLNGFMCLFSQTYDSISQYTEKVKWSIVMAYSNLMERISNHADLYDNRIRSGKEQVSSALRDGLEGAVDVAVKSKIFGMVMDVIERGENYLLYRKAKRILKKEGYSISKEDIGDGHGMVGTLSHDQHGVYFKINAALINLCLETLEKLRKAGIRIDRDYASLMY